jgi:DNA-binding IclR family transcriptional regulator
MPFAETSFARGLRVLTAVLDGAPVRADELVAALGLPQSTTYRYLRDLRERGLVEEVDGAYRPGRALRGETAGAASRTDLRRLARPTLEHLAEASGETALIAVRAGSHAVCLDQIESTHAMRMAFRPGERLPLHAGAASRVLLAFAPPGVASPAEPITERTPLGDDLARRLATIRATGVATSRGELVPGAIAIAVPILNGETCACSLALAAPDRRAHAAWQRRAKELLVDARATLEAVL